MGMVASKFQYNLQAISPGKVIWVPKIYKECLTDAAVGPLPASKGFAIFVPKFVHYTRTRFLTSTAPC